MVSARAMINRAEHWIGYREGAGNANRFSAEVGRPAESWCADFVSAVARESGNAAYFPDTASCAVGRDWFRRHGRLSVYPAVGAQVFFGADGNPWGPGGEHTGVVTAYTATTITVVAGNTNADGSPQGDGVYRRTYRRRSDYVESYGYPAYPEGLVCADPAWRGRPGITYFGQQADIRDLPAGTPSRTADLPAPAQPADARPAGATADGPPAPPTAEPGTADLPSTDLPGPRRDTSPDHTA
ncbi:CHAP domain-containing protein [Kitasatospora terrestris]